MSEFRVTARVGPRGYRTDISAGSHHYLIADEPVAIGGTDQGPNPYDLLLSSLGACTAITLRMYADRKGWEIEEITVHLRHSRHRPDAEQQPIDHIECAIELKGDLTQEQRTRMLEIADRCPVHKTLKAGVRISTKERQVPGLTS